MATSETFRRVFLPYCLIRVEEHGHAVVNRLYKPLGISDMAWVDYAQHAVKFAGLGPATVVTLSCEGSSDPDRIYLYNDGCTPTDGPKHWDAYQKRLAKLAAMRVEARYG